MSKFQARNTCDGNVMNECIKHSIPLICVNKENNMNDVNQQHSSTNDDSASTSYDTSMVSTSAENIFSQCSQRFIYLCSQ